MPDHRKVPAAPDPRLVTLHGGIGHGKTVRLGWSRRWYCHAEPASDPAGIPGATRIVIDQYAPDAEGCWRVIGPEHPLYLH